MTRQPRKSGSRFELNAANGPGQNVWALLPAASAMVYCRFGFSPSLSLENRQSKTRVTLLEKQTRLVDELAVFDDPHERLTAVIDRAKRCAALPPTERIDANRIHGCVSV